MKMEKSETMGFISHNEVKYLDVVLGGEEINMMARIFGGLNAIIFPPMLVLKMPLVPT